MKKLIAGVGLGVLVCVYVEAGGNATKARKPTAGLLTERAALLEALTRDKNAKRLAKLDRAATRLAQARTACLKLVHEAKDFYKDERGRVHGLELFKAARAKVERLAATRLPRLASSDRKKVRRLLQIDRELATRERPQRYHLNAFKLILMARGLSRTLRDYPRTKADARRVYRDLLVGWFNKGQLARVPAEDAKLHRLTNGLRRALGVGALVFNKALYTASRTHNEAMLKHRFFSHESPVAGQRTPEDRARNAGFEGPMGENIAQASSARAAFESWLESPNMRAGKKVAVMPAQWPPLEDGLPVRFYGSPSAPPLRTSQGVWVLQFGNMPGGRGAGGGHLGNMLNNTWKDMGGSVLNGGRSTGAYGDPSSPFGSRPEAFEGRRVEDVFGGGGGGGGGGGSFPGNLTLPPLL